MALGRMALGTPSRGRSSRDGQRGQGWGRCSHFHLLRQLRRAANSFPGTPGSLLAAASYYFGVCKIDQFFSPYWEQLMRAREERTLHFDATTPRVEFVFCHVLLMGLGMSGKDGVVSCLQKPVTLRYSCCAVTDLSNVYLYGSFLIFGH